MEILLIIVVIGIFISAWFFKKKLSRKNSLIISLIAGTFLIIWFWTMDEGQFFWRLLVTVVVIGGLIEQTFAMRKKTKIGT
ncbi:hypothetical protein [Rhodohalobacter barkolensis]|uniref:Uncharacterized protein n=1 Tax=Rhodohalobacter barkolensis TaxID=2053187 RepID=A0A2N0VFD1_9BACT|nr:hypothetical protein [Rhodohalobacter barkolensis]PKD42899.1 hypothetical protein CWD77_12665 [Rhodohalobacter barkolensis]